VVPFFVFAAFWEFPLPLDVRTQFEEFRMTQTFLARKRLFFWSPLLLACVSLLCTAVCIWQLYASAIEREKVVLRRELAEQMDALVDIAKANHWDPQKTLDRFIETRAEEHDVLGKTGEFVIAEEDGDNIRFLMKSRFIGKPAAMVIRSPDMSNMLRRALMGETGTGFTTSLEGNRILTAFAPVPKLHWGFAVKIDAAEIWAPLQKTALTVAAIALTLIIGGSILVVYLGQPLIRDLEKRIEEHRATEDALRQNRDQLQTICTEMVDGMIVTDAETRRIVNVNPPLCKMTGYTEDELLRMEFTELHPSENETEEIERFEATIHGYISINEGRPIRRKDGSIFYADISGHLILYNRRPCLLGLCRDTTERRKSEQDMLRAQQVAETANMAKTEFLANMSHELRTPMTAILGYSDMLLEETQEPDSAEKVQIIKRNASHLLTIIDDILDLSKIESGRLTVSLQPCNPCRIAFDVIETMRINAEAKKLKLDFCSQRDIPEQIRSDPACLRQILVNLVGNAIKFTEGGSIRVVATMDNRDPQTPRLRIDVCDTGIGLSKEQCDIIFQPFYQVDNSSQRKFGGVGLGLAICKRLAHLLGGDVSVASELGRGSVFTLTIAAWPAPAPAAQAPATTVPAAQPDDQVQKTATVAPAMPTPAERRTRKLDGRILLAEDGPDNQRLISTIFRKAGAEVVCVENGQVALERALADQAAGNPFDLIVMDMQMPVMDGYEAVEKLREAGYRLPIIALTAHAMKEDRAKCMAVGCEDYFTKPIDREALLNAVAKYLPSRTEVPASIVSACTAAAAILQTTNQQEKL
jgi:PAS domain S-box-containing protein